MKVLITDLKKYLPKLSWSNEQLAQKLSAIGHETDVVGNKLDIKLTSNRKDCEKLEYLAFDLAGLYPELGSNGNLISFKPGKTIPVTLEKINKILGSSLSIGDYQKIERIGFSIGDNAVIVPDFRTDISEGADIAEEVFRFIGVSALKIEPLSKEPPKESGQFQFLNDIRYALFTAGGTETSTISFRRSGAVKVSNPFSNKEPYLRADLVGGLLETLAKNPFSRRNIFYEIGQVFRPDEKTYLGIVLSGYKNPNDIVETIAKQIGQRLVFKAVGDDQLAQYSVKQPNVLVAEIPVIELTPKKIGPTISALPQFTKISSFPPLVREITVTPGDGTVFINSLTKTFPELLLVEHIDSYVNPNTGTTSDSYRMIFQKHTGSFTKDEISQIDNKIVELL
ncbi:MAG: hypothetical protein WEC81_02430 [Patescibacteria group bacterium]